MNDIQRMLDADEMNRIMPGLSDASDLPPTEGLGEQSPAPASVPPTGNTDAPLVDVGDVPQGLATFILAYIGHESVGDPIPALVHIWRHKTHPEIDEHWWPSLFIGPQRVDVPQPGDLVQLQYQGTYQRFWYGVVLDVAGEMASVAAASPQREVGDTVMELVQLRFKAMRGWQLNGSWPVVSFVRF